MIKYLRNGVCISLFVFFLLPITAFAQATGGSSLLGSLGTYQLGGQNITPSFTPTITDLSVGYLGQIFGTVGTVLHGTSGQLLGQLFKVFNIGVLVIAGIFLVYTIIMTVLNAAHEGEFMGRKWNSAWIALRTILGLGLLVPSATTGYSAIQVIVMWVVIQGVGFANMAWYSALQYITQGGQIYTPPQSNTKDMINLVGTIMEMQVCMYTNQNIWQQNQKAQQQAQAAQPGAPTGTTNTAAPQLPGTTNVQNWTANFTTIKDSSNLYHSIVQFPGNPYSADGQQDSACGQITFGTNASKEGLSQDQKTTTLKAAVNQIMLDLDSYSQQIAAVSTNANAMNASNNQNFPNQVETAIVGGAADWVNITLPIRSGVSLPSGESSSGFGGSLPNLNQTINDAMTQYINQSVSQGWIMAGRYYYALGSVQRKITEATSVNVNFDFYPAGFPGSWSPQSDKINAPQSWLDFSQSKNVNPAPNVQNTAGVSLGNQASILIANETNVFNYVSPAIAVAETLDKSQAIPTVSSVGDTGILSFIMTPIISAIYSALQSFSNATGDPILVLQSIGNTFLDVALWSWLIGTIGIFGLGAGSAIMASVQSLGYAVEDAILAFVPVFTVFLLTFAAIGGTFAYYVPLIPFIIYVFAAVGWIIAVIEAMVAAPLVALGVTHPEGGHDLLGKSEQAVMLLLSVFLRPVLMVIGLIAGMILSRVVLRFLNTGFFGIVFELHDFSLFAFMAILMIYCSLLVTIVNQSFSLIYQVPDRVMRWLNVQETTTTAQEALKSAQEGYQQIANATEKLGGSVNNASGELLAKKMARRRKRQERGGPPVKIKPK
jgi:defect-in-organelle-trafficking protein DotA